MQQAMTIPVFPLGVVLMPHMSLPLHIFEERYKIMIRECLEENSTFGIVFFDGGKIHKVGCTARIVEVLKEYDTGEMDIMTVGESRFVLKTLHDHKPYLTADISYFDDQPETETETVIRLADQGLAALTELDQMTGDVRVSDMPETLDIKRISFLISGIREFTPAEKQRLLEMTITRRRLETAVTSLQKVVQRAKLTRDIQSIIGGNGNILQVLHQRDPD